MSSLYKTIDSLCKQNKITITFLSREVGISKSTMSELKSERSKSLSSGNLGKVATYFNVSTDFLLGNEKKPTTLKGDELVNDEYLYALSAETQKLSTENKAKLLEMAKFFKQQQNKE